MSTYWGQSFPNYHTSIHVCRLVGETCHNHTPQIGLTTEKMSQKRLASMAWNRRVEIWCSPAHQILIQLKLQKRGDVSLHLVPSVQHQRSRRTRFFKCDKEWKIFASEIDKSFSYYSHTLLQSVSSEQYEGPSAFYCVSDLVAIEERKPLIHIN